MHEVHRTDRNAYHPAPGSAWTVHDAQMPDETAPCCSACGRCDCPSYDAVAGCCADQGDESCEGLYFAYVRTDGEILCEECAAQRGIGFVACDCSEW